MEFVIESVGKGGICNYVRECVIPLVSEGVVEFVSE